MGKIDFWGNQNNKTLFGKLSQFQKTIIPNFKERSLRRTGQINIEMERSKLMPENHCSFFVQQEAEMEIHLLPGHHFHIDLFFNERWLQENQSVPAAESQLPKLKSGIVDRWQIAGGQHCHVLR